MKHLFCAIEGNIAAGKSSMLKYLGEHLFAKTGLSEEILAVHQVAEPVKEWTNVAGINLLDKFYKEPHLYAHELQTCVIMSLMAQYHPVKVMALENEQRLKNPNTEIMLHLIERSVFSSRYIFAEELRQQDFLSPSQFELTKRLYDLFHDVGLVPQVDYLIYLESNPAMCLQRCTLRGRSEEDTISLAYLEKIDALHRQWQSVGFWPMCPKKVAVVNANGEFDTMLPLYDNICNDLKILLDQHIQD